MYMMTILENDLPLPPPRLHPALPVLLTAAAAAVASAAAPQGLIIIARASRAHFHTVF